MKKFKELLAIAICAVMVFAVTACRENNLAETLEYGELSGSVVSAYGNKQYLSGVTVKIGSLSTTTDSSGMYYFDKVPIQAGEIVFSLNDYHNTTMNLKVGNFIDKYADMPDAVMHMNGTIKGKITSVVNPTGEAGVKVSALGIETTTAADGTYTLAGLKIETSFQLQFAKDGFVSVNQALTKASHFASSSVLDGTTATSGVAASANRVLSVYGNITGKIVEIGGTPVAGATIAVGSANTTTASDGTFTLERMAINNAAAEYTLSVSKTGIQSKSLTFKLEDFEDFVFATGNIEVLVRLAFEGVGGINGAFTSGHNGSGGIKTDGSEGFILTSNYETTNPSGEDLKDFNSYIYKEFEITENLRYLTITTFKFGHHNTIPQLGIKITEDTQSPMADIVNTDDAVLIGNLHNINVSHSGSGFTPIQIMIDLESYVGKTVRIIFGTNSGQECCISSIVFTPNNPAA